MTDLKSTRMISFGELAVTPGVMSKIPAIDVWHGVLRHTNGDWGDVCEEDWKLNDAALKDDGRLLSVYTTSDGTRFWIITEWDRSATTVLLPEEY